MIQRLDATEVANLNPTGPTPHAGDDKAQGARLPTILLVEDTEDNRQMMKKLLEMSGYEVLEATNGEEAVQVTSTRSPKLILMDLSLPVIDGLTATRLIRNLPNGNDLPIIAVSAHDTADFHADALAAGCDAYITKPINYPELEEMVERLMASRKPKLSSL